MHLPVYVSKMESSFVYGKDLFLFYFFLSTKLTFIQDRVLLWEKKCAAILSPSLKVRSRGKGEILIILFNFVGLSCSLEI